MTSHTSLKIAVSLPAKTLRSVEVERKRLGRSRSSVVAEALEAWLRTRGATDTDRQYLEGYERQPEPKEDAVAAAVVAAWDPWDTEPRGRVAAPKKRRRAR